MPNVRALSMEKLTIDVRQSVFENSSQIVSKKRFKKHGSEFVMLDEEDELCGLETVKAGNASANMAAGRVSGAD